MAPTQAQPAPATLPPGLRVYAIGDTHGCTAQLDALLQQIAEDAAAAPETERRLVYLGDYVDRGADSRGLLERMLAPPPIEACVVPLIGNHEAMMLETLANPGDEERIAHWLRNGGVATLASYGLTGEDPPETWARRIGAEHLDFLRGLARRHAAGGYLFVHAGVRPGVPLDSQDEGDLIWIREPFLSSEADLGAVVVHGHTPGREPVIRRNRIGIDTGAVYGGKLTALVLWADRMRLLQA
ncbi:MAG: metallophosphoesterase family protein [Acetobacteraceae bacterium]